MCVVDPHGSNKSESNKSRVSQQSTEPHSSRIHPQSQRSRSLRSHSIQSESSNPYASTQSSASRTSSYLKAKATETVAKVAAAEANLQTELEAKQVEEELELLQLKQKEQVMAKKRQITELRLRAELEAEKVQQVYEDALSQQHEDEIRGSLMRPPSRASLSLHSANRVTVTPLKFPIREEVKVPQFPRDSTTTTMLPQQVHDLGKVMADAIRKSMAKAMTMTHTHIAKPSVFSGDALEYPDWKIAFEGLIGSCPYTPLQKLHILRDFVKGNAKEAIKGYFKLVANENAYQDAITTLDKEFGCEELVEECFLDQL